MIVYSFRKEKVIIQKLSLKRKYINWLGRHREMICDYLYLSGIRIRSINLGNCEVEYIKKQILVLR